ncbi:MAG: phytoene/squalene synthase family protein [Verrucomicrobiota bacterium]|jgi:farnesyl-diphosphate farnesyltransferase
MAGTFNDLLKATSRSFYLTLRVLPAAMRPQTGLAYLLARTTDTIADTELVSVQGRLDALEALRARILGETGGVLDFGRLSLGCALPAEKALLERVEEALRLLEQLPEADRRLIREVLRVIISGQDLDLNRFAGAKAGAIAALETEADLDDYTYRVAGCVGEFWTRICRLHLFPEARLDEDLLLRTGVRFGKGLQLVNILRDIPSDLRKGRCYLPRQSLAAAGLSPADLLAPGNLPRFRPLYDQWLARAESHLAAGWDYTNALPPGQFRLRLACAWPLLIGVRTLRRLRQENILDYTRRVKVSRPEIRALIGRSVLLYPWPAAWRGQFDRELGRKS